jgi:zinc finger RNA-binding protein
LIAFRQIYKVLGMEPLPAPKQWRLARKRRRESAEAEDLAEEKKDKKETV